MADANTKAKTASKSTRTRKSAAASEALTQALATAPVQYIPVRPLRGLGKAGTPAAPPLLPLRRLPDFFFLPLLLLFMLFLFLFLFLFPMLMLLSRCCRQKNGNTTTRRALAPFGSPSVPAGSSSPTPPGRAHAPASLRRTPAGFGPDG